MVNFKEFDWMGVDLFSVCVIKFEISLFVCFGVYGVWFVSVDIVNECGVRFLVFEVFNVIRRFFGSDSFRSYCGGSNSVKIYCCWIVVSNVWVICILILILVGRKIDEIGVGFVVVVLIVFKNIVEVVSLGWLYVGKKLCIWYKNI